MDNLGDREGSGLRVNVVSGMVDFGLAVGETTREGVGDGFVAELRRKPG